MNIQSLIGLNFQEGKKIIENNDMTFRLEKNNGEFFFLTEDYVSNRVTLEIENNIITNSRIG